MRDLVPLPLPAPPLRDERIALRQWAAADLPDVVRGVDELVTRFRYSVPLDEPQAREWLAAVEPDRGQGRRLELAIVDAASDRAVGSIALWDIRPQDRNAMISYWLGPAGRGRGLATRAVTLLSRWAFAELALARLELLIEPDNEASRRLAERCGYRLEGRLRSYHYRPDGTRSDLLVFSLLPQEHPGTQ